MSEENYQPGDFIPKPCKEDWHAMSGDERRRYCEKCDTHVVNLTGKSADEIRALHKQNGGKLCGAFRLGKPLALGSGIASLALASCAEKARTVGIVCPPSPVHEKPDVDRDGGTTSTKPQPEKPSVEKEKPIKGEIKIDPPMMLGLLCPRELPEPKRDVGPI